MSGTLPIFTIQERVGIITLNDPQNLNALATPAWHELAVLCADVAALGDQVGAVVLTGAGRGFCAGANLAQTSVGSEAAGSSPQDVTRQMEQNITPVLLALRGLPVPLVTAVNGVAAGVGMSLALCADVVIAAREASFVAPFMPRLGLVPDGGLTWLLPRLTGRGRASALMLLGEKISAEQAERWGMVWKLVEGPALMDSALAVARQLASGPRHAAREIRECLALSESNSLAEQLHHEAVRQGAMVQTAAFRQGLQAFLEKKQTGRTHAMPDLPKE